MNPTRVGRLEQLTQSEFSALKRMLVASEDPQTQWDGLVGGLLEASERGTELVRSMAGCGVDTNLHFIQGMTLLGYATRWLGCEQMQALLSLGPDLLAQDDNGDTALHLAARHGDPESIVLLLAQRNDLALLDTVNAQGFTAQQEAMNRQHMVVAHCLEVARQKAVALDEGQTLDAFAPMSSVRQGRRM